MIRRLVNYLVLMPMSIFPMTNRPRRPAAEVGAGQAEEGVRVMDWADDQAHETIKRLVGQCIAHRMDPPLMTVDQLTQLRKAIASALREAVKREHHRSRPAEMDDRLDVAQWDGYGGKQ